jgi:outer membrane protein assembly factor BamB
MKFWYSFMSRLTKVVIAKTKLMIIKLTTLYLMVFFFCVLVTKSDEWPIPRGNSRLTGVADTGLPTVMEPLWVFQADEAIESTPAIFEGTVFITSLDGNLYALEMKTGQKRWQYSATDIIKSSPSVAAGVVYFGDESGVFHAVDGVTGQQRWTFETEAGIISAANFDQELVVFGSYDQYLYCLKQDNGELVWKYETEGYINGTPAIVNHQATVTGCDSYLRLIDLKTGKQSQQLP